MTDFERREIRGITGKLLITVISGSIAVCISIIGAAIYLERRLSLYQTDIAIHNVKIENHEYRITQLEIKHK